MSRLRRSHKTDPCATWWQKPVRKYDWYVLDKQDDRALILTEKVIGKRAYHNQECEITWETCDMRKYLNGEFYNSFSETDHSWIIEVVNENNDNPCYGTSGGNPPILIVLNCTDIKQSFTELKSAGYDVTEPELMFYNG